MITFLVGFLITLISGIISYLSKRNENFNAGKNNGSDTALFVILVVGAISTLIAGIISDGNETNNKIRIQQKDSLYSDLLLKTRDSIISAKNEINQLRSTNSYENSRLKDSLLASKNQIIANQKSNFLELYNQTTGGDVIPHLFLTAYEPNAITIGIINSGKYSLQNIKISYVDNFKMKAELGDFNWDKHPDQLLKYSDNFDIPALHPSVFMPLFSQSIPPELDDLWYTFYVFYKNGTYRWHVRWNRNKLGEFRIINSQYVDEKTGQDIKFDRSGVGIRVGKPRYKVTK